MLRACGRSCLVLSLPVVALNLITLLLLAEVVGLIVALARSVSSAVGKQLEIMSLILIRQSFEELSHLPEPVTEADIAKVVPYLVSDALGALIIFVVIGLYYRLQRHRPITRDKSESASFIGLKKLVALILLAAVSLATAHNAWQLLRGGELLSLFEMFYTLLIFADVLIVLISMAYSTAYHVLFRYFGFAVAAVFVRLALSAPRIADAGLGLGASLFALALTWAYNVAAPEISDAGERGGA